MPAVPQKNAAALDGDVWFRPLANKRYKAKSGRINHAAFKTFLPPLDGSLPWKAELSGRLLSATGDQSEIERDAQDRADRQKQAAKARGQRGDEFFFVGLIYARVTDVRSWALMKANVIFVPDEPNHPYPDSAHAILVAIDLTPDEIRSEGKLLDFLQDAFAWLEPNQIGVLANLKN
jgi:hypothetical protein